MGYLDIEPKEYVVKCKLLKDFTFIITAKDPKDAINKICYECNNMNESIFEPIDFVARSLGSLHSEHGKIIALDGSVNTLKRMKRGGENR